MKTLLLDLEKKLIEKKNPILDYLDPPSGNFDEQRFIELTRKLKLEPSSDLIDLYSWKKGLKGELALDISFDYRMFSFGSPIFYKDTSNLYILDESTDGLFTGKYLPFVFHGILEDPILIDLSKRSKTRGSIYYFCPNVTLSATPVQIYDSLQSMIESIIECYQKEAYIIDEAGLLDVNDLEQEITRKLNPKSDYWNY